MDRFTGTLLPWLRFSVRPADAAERVAQSDVPVCYVLAAHRALERLYDRLGDLPGVARSLDGQLVLTRNLGARVELLRRLGEHAAHRMGDDTSAESRLWPPSPNCSIDSSRQAPSRLLSVQYSRSVVSLEVESLRLMRRPALSST